MILLSKHPETIVSIDFHGVHVSIHITSDVLGLSHASEQQVNKASSKVNKSEQEFRKSERKVMNKP
jgi:hypothetical protein